MRPSLSMNPMIPRSTEDGRLGFFIFQFDFWVLKSTLVAQERRACKKKKKAHELFIEHTQNESGKSHRAYLLLKQTKTGDACGRRGSTPLVCMHPDDSLLVPIKKLIASTQNIRSSHCKKKAHSLQTIIMSTHKGVHPTDTHITQHDLWFRSHWEGRYSIKLAHPSQKKIQ